MALPPDFVDLLQEFADAEVQFGAPQQVIDAVESARGLDVAWMGLPPMRVDLMREIPGVRFDVAWSRRVVTDWNGVLVDAALLERALSPPDEAK